MFNQQLKASSAILVSPFLHPLIAYPGLGCGGSRLSGVAQTSLSLATHFNSSSWVLQGTHRPKEIYKRVLGLPRAYISKGVAKEAP